MTTDIDPIDPDLWRLRAAHGNLWHIRRNGSLWVATRRTDDGTEPTIISDTTEEFVSRLLHPAPRWGRRYTRLWGPDRL